MTLATNHRVRFSCWPWRLKKMSTPLDENEGRPPGAPTTSNETSEDPTGTPDEEVSRNRNRIDFGDYGQEVDGGLVTNTSALKRLRTGIDDERGFHVTERTVDNRQLSRRLSEKDRQIAALEKSTRAMEEAMANLSQQIETLNRNTATLLDDNVAQIETIQELREKIRALEIKNDAVHADLKDGNARSLVYAKAAQSVASSAVNKNNKVPTPKIRKPAKKPAKREAPPLLLRFGSDRSYSRPSGEGHPRQVRIGDQRRNNHYGR